MSSALAAAHAAPAAERQIRVMVVDDAVVARSMMARWIESEPDMMIAASLRTGREALDTVTIHAPDVVLLDVDMPELDGITALPLLLAKQRDLVVIMVSTLTRRSAELSLRALALGATDYIPKPETTYEAMTSAAFRREMIDKVRGLGRKRLLLREGAPPFAPEEAPAPRPAPLPAAKPLPEFKPQRAAEKGEIALRPFALAMPRALLIGSSTGGPQALTALFEKLTAAVDRAPVLITQHMPPTFTTVLAEHLRRVSGRGAHEAEDGEPVLAGGIYLAPGGRHMRVLRDGEIVKIALTDDPPINFCRPSVDPLFSSAAAVWGPAVLAVVLTGMGSDGTQGAADVVAAGGSVIAQDEATSVVWGMPRSVAQAGLCSAVLPLDQIPGKILRLLLGSRS
ncbi:MAG: chemotaxis response regulator protein-glutamate methylesterase [Xanthobacteraceae bacterium]|jgi:two-component system chemotaxis response regulator CheB